MLNDFWIRFAEGMAVAAILSIAYVLLIVT